MSNSTHSGIPYRSYLVFIVSINTARYIDITLRLIEGQLIISLIITRK